MLSRAELRNEETEKLAALDDESPMSVLNEAVDGNGMFWSSCGDSSVKPQLLWPVEVAAVERVSTEPLYWWPYAPDRSMFSLVKNESRFSSVASMWLSEFWSCADSSSWRLLCCLVSSDCSRWSGHAGLDAVGLVQHLKRQVHVVGHQQPQQRRHKVGSQPDKLAVSEVDSLEHVFEEVQHLELNPSGVVEQQTQQEHQRLRRRLQAVKAALPVGRKRRNQTLDGLVGVEVDFGDELGQRREHLDELVLVDGVETGHDGPEQLREVDQLLAVQLCRDRVERHENLHREALNAWVFVRDGVGQAQEHVAQHAKVEERDETPEDLERARGNVHHLARRGPRQRGAAPVLLDSRNVFWRSQLRRESMMRLHCPASSSPYWRSRWISIAHAWSWTIASWSSSSTNARCSNSDRFALTFSVGVSSRSDRKITDSSHSENDGVVTPLVVWAIFASCATYGSPFVIWLSSANVAVSSALSFSTGIIDFGSRFEISVSTRFTPAGMVARHEITWREHSQKTVFFISSECSTINRYISSTFDLLGPFASATHNASTSFCILCANLTVISKKLYRTISELCLLGWSGPSVSSTVCTHGSSTARMSRRGLDPTT
ncbi:hypothetical protein OGATHE_001990 [Ogataea polymorpha]|uniref:Uncharacterized protein n=1 Tax=Ogataea polymorpha TaxID=460523 RepID=A0A9P8PM27_9ASCO|nr:hypothetical protein OGATHE_001990 [Ogataea polymorpha]